MKNFIIAHILLILLSIAITYFGLYMLQILCYILGGIIILYGIICVLNTYVFTGVFDKFGNEYVVTNLEGNLWTLVFAFLFGAYVMAIPFTDGDEALRLFMFIPAGLLIWVLLREHDNFADDASIGLLDIIITTLYIGSGVLYNVLAQAEAMVELAVIPISIGILIHIFRTVYVCRNYNL
jgi:hypothetical protein